MSFKIQKNFGINIGILGGNLGSAAGATVLLTVAPGGAGPLLKRAQWRGSVPDTRATGPGPKISKVPLQS